MHLVAHRLTKQVAGRLLEGICLSHQGDGRINLTQRLSVPWISVGGPVANSRGHPTPLQGTVFASRSGKARRMICPNTLNTWPRKGASVWGKRDRRELSRDATQ